MRAFVTGATGFIGTHVAQRLSARGWSVLALRRPSSDVSELLKLPRVELVEGDITDRESLRRCVPEGIDAVFHVAGSVAILPSRLEHTRYGVNQAGTRNVVDACLEKKAGRLVYTSTVLTYDFRAGRPVTEDTPPNLWWDDAYGKSKRLADAEVERGAAAGLDTVFLHPSAVFGAHDKTAWSRMFVEIKRGLPLPFAPPGGGSVCHARPVADAHVAAFEKGRRGRHYILGGPDVTWLEVAQEIGRLLGVKAPSLKLPVPLFKAYGWSEYLLSSALGRRPSLSPHVIETLCIDVYSDSSRAVRELGYAPSSLREMLEDCHRWMLAERML